MTAHAYTDEQRAEHQADVRRRELARSQHSGAHVILFDEPVMIGPRKRLRVVGVMSDASEEVRERWTT